MPRWTSFLCALLLLASAPAANGQMYLRLVGANQGPINGEVVLGPLTGTIATSSFSIAISTLIDPGSGLPTGQVNVTPLSLMKQTDSATIGILQAMRDTETLTTCQLDAYRDNGQGGTELFVRLTLMGARIESWNLSAVSAVRPMESISIVFDLLEWRDFITGQTYVYTMGASSTLPLLRDDLALVTAPNPTAGETQFAFRLPGSGSASIDVYDVRGRHVSKVFEGNIGTEQAIVSWDGRDALGQPVATGIYLVKMRAGEWLTTRKLAVVR